MIVLVHIVSNSVDVESTYDFCVYALLCRIVHPSNAAVELETPHDSLLVCQQTARFGARAQKFS